MTTLYEGNTFPVEFGLDGMPLQGGSLYFGAVGLNPVTSPITVYWDAAGTQPAKQPIKTISGMPSRNGVPSRVWIPGDYSSLVQDSKGRQVRYEPSVQANITASVLAAAGGSALVGFQQALAGSVARVTLDKLRERVSVFDFMTTAQIADVKARTLAVDVTLAIQAAINAVAGTAAALYFPPGTYLISATLQMASDLRLLGEGRLSVIKSTTITTDLLFISGSGTSAADTVKKQNVRIGDLSFDGLTDSYAIRVLTTDNVEVRGCYANNCFLFKCDSHLPINRNDGTPDPNATAGFTAESQCCTNINVSGNVVQGNSTATLAAGINFQYVADAVCANNVIRGCRHGVQWWGGDSNNARGGQFANPRWARRIAITGNVVDTMMRGGIWGSMGQGITVAGNTVKDCGDVGIDFEGTWDSVASGNVVANTGKGCLSTFFNCRNVLFTGNTCTQTGAFLAYDGQVGRRLYLHANGVGNAERAQDVKVVGNHLAYLATDGTLGDALVSVYSSLTFEANTLVNTTIAGDQNNSGDRTIARNQLQFTVAATAAFNAIDIGHSDLGRRKASTIKNNEVISSVAQPAGSIGIRSVQVTFGGGMKTIVRNNEVWGFPTSINVADLNTNAGATVKNSFLVTENVVDGLIDDTSSAGKGIIFARNNTDFDGNAVAVV